MPYHSVHDPEFSSTITNSTHEDWGVAWFKMVSLYLCVALDRATYIPTISLPHMGIMGYPRYGIVWDTSRRSRSRHTTPQHICNGQHTHPQGSISIVVHSLKVIIGQLLKEQRKSIKASRQEAWRGSGKRDKLLESPLPMPCFPTPRSSILFLTFNYTCAHPGPAR